MINPQDVVKKQLNFYNDHEHVTGLKADNIVKSVAIYEIEDNLIKNVWFVYE